MGESGTSNAAGLLFCLTGHQSPSCTANEEDPGLADGLGETTDVQLGQKARARTNGSLMRKLHSHSVAQAARDAETKEGALLQGDFPSSWSDL